ncbi:hypothetical protein [Azospirillum picis]|uniref:Transcription elongation factor Elf1 n=1 Tax=Azospirillum picis TaxID=488438 RepID=A0ABU0MPM1_9PROT|nr:hypothetical protein [Azospirillum picis]MBP2301585.1 transcription elongation factor Elf1 [Azospirillum picis]MDQ0535417.1 transcription elongation factor Elf1 [Azospirillum picis]
MRPDSLENLHDGARLYAFCDPCGRSVTLDVPDLIERLGGGFPVTALRGRLTCKECGRRGIFRRSGGGASTY